MHSAYTLCDVLYFADTKLFRLDYLMNVLGVGQKEAQQLIDK